MSNRIWALMLKDARLVVRNWFLVITLFVAFTFIVLINFVIPDQLSLEPSVFVLDNSGGALSEMKTDLVSRNNAESVDNLDMLKSSVKDKSGSFGMILSGDKETPAVEFMMQGYESQKIKDLIELEMRDYLGELGGQDDSVKVIYTGGKTKAFDVPFNHSILPLFLLMEPVLLGLFFIATLMFFEKAEGTIASYRVSPGSLFEFLISKVIVLFILGFLSMYLVTLTTVGFNANLGLMFIIAIAGSLFGSSLGLLISSFFDNISKAMVWIIFASILLSAPFAAYYMPNFSPIWIKVMPTYSLLFALKETIYQTGQTDIVWQSVMLSGSLGLLLFGAAQYKYQKSMS